MRLVWLRETRSDIQRLYDFLIDKDLRAAERAIRMIQYGAQQLLEHPHRGMDMGDGSHRRQLIMPFGAGAYVLRYRIQDGKTIVVIRVWHSREARL